jgi:hypothetical protein
MAEASGSGSIPLTSESGSGRPKNKWIRWILIRIRIRNNAYRRILRNNTRLRISVRRRILVRNNTRLVIIVCGYVVLPWIFSFDV